VTRTIPSSTAASARLINVAKRTPQRWWERPRRARCLPTPCSRWATSRTTKEPSRITWPCTTKPGGATGIPPHPVPGNHEYEISATAEGYFAYFGAAAGGNPNGYYSYDIGAWHMIALNSNCREVGGCTATSAQGKWLKADLATNPTDCTLAYWHHPRFSSSQTGTPLKPFWKMLYAGGVDVVLNGHVHNYERFAPQNPDGVADPQGIRQFVLGTGGHTNLGFKATPRANSEARNSSAFGILELTLRPGSYDWRFRSINDSFTDSGSDTCN
jgi:hypothetical protein